MANTLLDKIIFGVKRIAYQLREKPKADLDSHVMEHMVFYHGLTGSSPENEKETKLVRADIKEAINDHNANGLALALKLAPTIWQDGLAEIFSKLTDGQKQTAIKLLIEGDHSALAYPDWQVKANAANILAWLDAKTAAPALAACLNDDTVHSALSFVYIAYAIGKLQGEAAKTALYKNLSNQDSWFRVDAAGALAAFDFESTAALLCEALLNEQEALDYMTYAISRQQKPAKFLQGRSMQEPGAAKIIQGGCQMICGLIEAAQNSFNADLIYETESHLCLPLLKDLCEHNADPILVDTTIILSEWLVYNSPPQIQTEAVKEKILANLKSAQQGNLLTVAELTHTIKLAGRLKLQEAEGVLCELLDQSGMSATEAGSVNLAPTDFARTELISVLGELGDEKTGAKLVNLANQIINIDERCQKPMSKQPVWEEEPEKAETYWRILKALGNLPSVETIAFLSKALSDYAPDKRACALESLTALHKNNPQLSLPQSLNLILQQALKDPSPIMQLAAITAITDLKQTDLIADIIPLIDAQENTVSKQALASIACLYPDTPPPEIRTALQAKLKTIKEEHKKIGIMDILHEKGGGKN